jgi:glycosyltransferase involved in cell wall biosynthesis
MNAVKAVYVVVPQGIGDPRRPSGGNTYDRRLCQALGSAGWSVWLREVAGAWPRAGEIGREALDRTLRELPDGSLVLVDGLVASTLPRVVVPACRRLRLVVLMHMPMGTGASQEGPLGTEREVACAASSIVTTSTWARNWLIASYELDPARVHVAHPGVDPAAPATATRDGGRLLCVGAVTPGKGHDQLLAALVQLADLPWRCACVGAQSVAPEFVARLRRNAQKSGLERRFVLTGPRTGSDLDAAYAEADLLVLASRAETYGMVVTEALARGVPVIAAEVGGVPEALGTTTDGTRPGLLVPPDDVAALSDALRRWLSDADMRQTLRTAALKRRAAGLKGWSQTADRVARVLLEVPA